MTEVLSASRTVRPVPVLPRFHAVLGVALALALLSPVPASAGRPARAELPRSTSAGVAAPAAAPWTYERVAGPERVLVRDAAGVLLATFTVGSRTVVLAGPVRTFAESTTSAVVRTGSWVRLLPAPATRAVDAAWLATALADRSPDVLAVAAEYATGASTVRTRAGAVVSSDASYGPLVDGRRQEGADWNDYLQVRAAYDGVGDAPEAAQAGALDCSGFVRMVFGRRLGHPMSLAPDGVRLPRRAVQMHTGGPGTLVTGGSGRPDLGVLLPGDLVLFDASTDDGTAVDHVGIYLGRDSTGRPRFVSSRKTVDGPTLGDVGGRSTLDGTGLYATAFRAVRRL